MQTYNDRTVDSTQDVPEIPDMLERVLIHAIEEAKTHMLNGEELVPFTCLVVKDKLFIESHPAETAEDCFALARQTVGGARGAVCYAFCYDGYIDSDSGMLDCIIAEGGMPGGADGFAAGCIYRQQADLSAFDEENTGETSANCQAGEAKDENGSGAASSEAAPNDVTPSEAAPQLQFEDEIIYVGMAPNFMEKLKNSNEYSEEDIDARYITGEGFSSADETSDANMA